jgi:hypothetical protein
MIIKKRICQNKKKLFNLKIDIPTKNYTYDVFLPIKNKLHDV